MTSDDLRRQRRERRHGCWGHVIICPIVGGLRSEPGTLLRTGDAVGACMAVPRTAPYRQALRMGDTLARCPCIHWVDRKLAWIQSEKSAGGCVVGVELDGDATRLGDLAVARQRTAVLLRDAGPV